MTTTEKRLRIQGLRGLACILLVLYHVVGDSPLNGLRIQDGPVRWLNDGLAYLRMPLFTFLSGWVYGQRPFKGDSIAFLQGKARRLLVPMLVVGTLFAAVQALVPGSNRVIENWSLLHIEPVAHFWYLESLFWIFICIWFLEKWGNLDRVLNYLLCAAGATALYFLFRGPRTLGIEGAIYLSPYFLWGLAVSRFDLWTLLTHRTVQILMLLLTGCSVYALGQPVPNPDRRTVDMLLVGLSLCTLSLSFSLRWRWLCWIGSASYAVYLFHVFFTASSRIVFQKVGLDLLPLQVVAGLLIGILGPCAIQLFAARNGWLRLLLLGQSTQLTPIKNHLVEPS